MSIPLTPRFIQPVDDLSTRSGEFISVTSYNAGVKVPTGTNLEYAKRYNLRLVLETIRRYGPLTRAEIAEMTALTKQTIHNITAPLIEHALITEAKRSGKRTRRGPPSTELELNAHGAFAVGLDFDREHLTGVLVDLSGEVRKRMSQRHYFPEPEEALALMASFAEALTVGVQRSRIQGVGVGFPGPLRITRAGNGGICNGGVGNQVGGVVNPDFFPGWHNVPVVERLSAALELPIFLENNATAAAIGESFYGVGRTIGSFFYVFLGIGLGGGVILNAGPFEGFEGNAGEIGFMPTGTAASGEVERLGSFFNLPALYRQLASGGVAVTSLAELEGVFAARNQTLLDWLESAAHHLATALVGIEFSFDPEAFILGGSWPPAMIDFLIARLEQRLPKLRIAEKAYQPPLIRAQAGEDAAAMGVATLPIYSTLAPHPTLLYKPQPL